MGTARSADPHRVDRRVASQHGFTLIEVMVAAFILLVGVLGVLSMLNFSSYATTTTKAREQGVALQRELVEAARSIPYDELLPNSVVPKIQAEPDLGDDQPGVPGWQIVRRNITYTVAVGSCAVDDPGDGRGNVDDVMFCPPGSTATSTQCRTLLGIDGSVQGVPGAAATAALDIGSCGIDLDLDGQVDYLTRSELAVDAGLNLCVLGLGWCPSTTTDSYPDDYKRIVTLVRWNVGGGSRFALQSTTVPNPGSAAAPRVDMLNTRPAGTTSITSGASVDFDAVTSRTPDAVAWSVDGEAKGTAGGAGTAWSFRWDLGTVSPLGSGPSAGEVLDGAYVVSAQAFDSVDGGGQTKAYTINLNRRVPYPPREFAGGRNPSGSGGAGTIDFEWAPSSERDVAGYRVYRIPSSGSPVQVCPAALDATTTTPSCRATGQPDGDSLRFQVVAYDRQPGTQNLRAGEASETITVRSGNHAPPAPGTLAASTSGGNTVLSWGAAGNDPDWLTGDHVAFYRIYRDGKSYANRYDRTGTANELTYTDVDTNGVSHSYAVVAVDTQLAESPFSNTVTR